MIRNYSSPLSSRNLSECGKDFCATAPLINSYMKYPIFGEFLWCESNNPFVSAYMHFKNNGIGTSLEQ